MMHLKKILDICANYKKRVADTSMKNPHVYVGDATGPFYRPIKLRFEIEVNTVRLFFCVDKALVYSSDAGAQEVFETYSGLITNLNIFEDDYIKASDSEIECFIEINDDDGIHEYEATNVALHIATFTDDSEDTSIIIS
jgi:hypothetical protein